MPQVRIVTDSNSCLPPELIKEYNIHIVPMGLTIDGKLYRDQVDITPEEFWQIFKEKSDKMSTSPPTPGDFTEAFTEIGKTTDSIVCIPVSKALSATNEIAGKAKEIVNSENPDLKIEVIDSNTASGAQGLIALEAARAAKAGKSLEQVIQAANDMKPRAKYLMGLETLKYLIKIGRAPKIAYLGELFGVKPITGMVSGTGLVESLGKTRGKKKMMKMLADMLGNYVDAGKPLHVLVHYTDSLEDGEQLKDMVTSKYNCVELYMSAYTPVMASATGPVLAVSFYSE